MHRSRRPIRALAVLAATTTLAALGVALPAEPASAFTSSEVFFFASPSNSKLMAVTGGRAIETNGFPTHQILAGHFTDGTTAEAFLYNPGSGQDALVQFFDDGRDLSLTLQSMSVGGRYQPFVGDFDSNGRDDIFWYAPGTARDYIWYFQADGSVVSVPQTVNGSYTPVPLHLDGSAATPGIPAIVWYGRGTRGDALWTFPGPVGTHVD